MMRLNVQSLKNTVRGLRRAGKQMLDAAEAGTIEAGKAWEGAVRRSMSMRTYSLEQLAAQDHPYAHRHGSISIHRSGSDDLAHPELRIHTRSGSLLNALKTDFNPRGMRFSMHLDAGIAPHAPYVIEGTRVMLGRDVLNDAALAPKTRKRMLVSVSGAMVQAIKNVKPVGGG